MRRVLLLVAVAGLAAGLGAAATAEVQDRRQGDRGAVDADPREATTTTTTPLPVSPSGPGVLLVWAQGGLPAAAIDALSHTPGVLTVSVMRDGRADLVASADANGAPVDTLEPGWAIALDVAAVDPVSYADIVPAADRAAILGLGAGEAILSETSADLRRIGQGGRLELAGGTTLTVVDVVPDTSVGAAEVVVDAATGATMGVTPPRAALVAHQGDRAALEAAVVAAAPGTPVRFRAPGETPYLRAADAVLPQALVKDRFGEFAHRSLGEGTRDIEIDPAWVAAVIVEAEVPILGSVRCHRSILDRLTGALAAAEAAGLGPAIVAAGFDGCFVPRFVQPGAPLSRHAWGIALDIGFAENPTGVAPAVDERVVEVFRDAGFTWGGTWLVPDPAHYEVVEPG